MNPKNFPNLRNRRDFFRQASCAALGTIGLSCAMRDLRLINTAVAQTGFGDYKALVCLFLAGGNDANNWIIPGADSATSSDFLNYSTIRGNLTIPHNTLLPITADVSDGRNYAFHPACGELQTLFSEGKLATIFNVGTLLYPITRAQYNAKTVPTPPQLFSHSDQVTHWQTSIPDQPPRTGWGGRIADRLHPLQYQLLGDGNPTATSAKISLCSSIAGANTYEVGDVYQQYHVSQTGAVVHTGVTQDPDYLQSMRDLLGLSSVNLQRAAYAGVLKNAIDVGGTLNASITPFADPTDSPLGGYAFTGATGSQTAGYAGGQTHRWANELPGIYNPALSAAFASGLGGFPNTTVGRQLKMVARMIAARNTLQMGRQIFFVQVGGYDTHTGQLNTAAPQTGSHANLLNEVSECVFAFQRAMEQLSLSEKVTTFTASDFGRTFPTNGAGSDHGWGSHHIVVGGAVNGRQTYGTFPIHQINGPDDTSTGRWIPTLAVDQYSATLAKWFGVSSGDMSAVFPNLGRFSSSDLGFMETA